MHVFLEMAIDLVGVSVRELSVDEFFRGLRYLNAFVASCRFERLFVVNVNGEKNESKQERERERERERETLVALALPLPVCPLGCAGVAPPLVSPCSSRLYSPCLRL